MHQATLRWSKGVHRERKAGEHEPEKKKTMDLPVSTAGTANRLLGKIGKPLSVGEGGGDEKAQAAGEKTVIRTYRYGELSCRHKLE